MYYGWWIVANSTVGLALGWSVLAVFTFGLFSVPLELEFGWSQEAISMGFVVMSWTSILSTIIFGRLVDRYGIRHVMLPSIVGLSICLAAMCLMTDRLWQFYLTLFSIILFGGATSPVCYCRALVGWFDRGRGMAMGIGLAGVGLGVAIIPGLVSITIDSYGWRTAYAGMAVFVLAINFPITWLLMREEPSVAQAKINAPKEFGERQVHAESVEVLASDVWRKPAFWMLLVAFAFIGFANSAGLAHQFPMMARRGIDPDMVALAGSLFGISLIFGRVLAGYLMDKFFAPYVSGVFILMPAIAMAMYASEFSGNWVLLGTVLFGLGVGAEFDAISIIVSRYFGTLSFGTISAMVFAVFHGAAVGSWVVGRLYDQTGDYTVGFWLVSASMAVGAIILFLMPPFQSAEQVS